MFEFPPEKAHLFNFSNGNEKENDILDKKKLRSTTLNSGIFNTNQSPTNQTEHI